MASAPDAMSGSSDKTILYVIGSLDLGGAEAHLVSLTPRLKRHGWQPILYCLTHTGAQAAELANSGVEVMGPPFDVYQGARWRPIRALAIALSAIKLFWVLVRRRPAIAHFFCHWRTRSALPQRSWLRHRSAS